MKRRNILFVTPKLNRAGAQMLVLDICKRLPSDIYKTRVCVFTEDKGVLAEEFRKIRISVDSIVFKPLTLFPLRLFRYLRKVKPNILHIHDVPALAPVAIVVARLAGIKRIIYSIHGIWKFYSWKGLIIKSSWRIAKSLVEKFLPVSKAAQEFWEREYHIPSDKATIIYNGIDLSEFEPENIKLKKEENEDKLLPNFSTKGPIIGTVGSLTPIKGQKYLLQAMPKVLEKFPEAKLVIVGEGELRENLEGLSSSLGISDKVEFTGVRSDIPQLLQTFDVFVFPSAWKEGQRVGETLGIAVLEAMAMERPVVASDFSGIPEIVKDGKTGLLVPPGDQEAIADAIIWLIRHRREANIMGKKARKRVSEHFSIDSTVSVLEEVYSCILN